MQVFGKEWFSLHQEKLIKLANSFIGEYVFKFKKMGHPRTKGVPVVDIGPNYYSYYVWQNGKIYLQRCFFGRNCFAANLFFSLYYVWLAMHIWDFLGDRISQSLSFGFTTFNPQSGAGGANVTVDGTTFTDAWDVTLSTLRGEAGTGSTTVGVNNGVVRVTASTTSNQYARMDRGVYTFDTSSLGAGASIASAVFSLYCDTAPPNGLSGNASANSAIVLVAVTLAANNNVANSDFGGYGTTDFGRSVKESLLTTSGAYNDITLNASGKSGINKTGVTAFGTRYGWDFDNTTTGLTWASSADQYIQCRFADNATNIPKLVVTLGTLYTKTLTETLTMSQTLAKKTSMTLAETITMTVTIAKKTVRTLKETLTMSVTLTSLKTHLKTLTETVTMTVSLTKKTVRKLTETLTMTVTIAKETLRKFTESFTVTDSITLKPIPFLKETIVITDKLLKSTTAVLKETITMTVSLVKSTTRVLKETITMTVTIAEKVVGHLAKEIITITDKLTIPRPWRKRTPPSTSWTKRTPPTTTWGKRIPYDP